MWGLDGTDLQASPPPPRSLCGCIFFFPISSDALEHLIEHTTGGTCRGGQHVFVKYGDPSRLLLARPLMPCSIFSVPSPAAWRCRLLYPEDAPPQFLLTVVHMRVGLVELRDGESLEAIDWTRCRFDFFLVCSPIAPNHTQFVR